MTALEKGRVYAGFLPDLQGQAKQQAHAEYLAAILDPLVARHRAFLLFLPHSLERDGSDVVAARHVVEQMKLRPDDLLILEQDCGPRLLKSIIRDLHAGTPLAVLKQRFAELIQDVGADAALRDPELVRDLAGMRANIGSGAAQVLDAAVSMLRDQGLDIGRGDPKSPLEG